MITLFIKIMDYIFIVWWGFLSVLRKKLLKRLIKPYISLKLPISYLIEHNQLNQFCTQFHRIEKELINFNLTEHRVFSLEINIVKPNGIIGNQQYILTPIFRKKVYGYSKISFWGTAIITLPPDISALPHELLHVAKHVRGERIGLVKHKEMR